MKSNNQPSTVKYNPQFKQEIDIYIEECQKNKKIPTIKGFAERIGTDEQSIWAWANKKRKDEQGNLTDKLARPNFLAQVQKLEKLSKEKPKQEKLDPKRERFCQLYASDKEFFGNGVETYIEVYEPDKSKPNWYKTACAAASRMLSNVKVFSRINEILEDRGLNDVFVDKQLLFIINQHADFGSKVAAIKEYNKLRQRITEKINVHIKGKPVVEDGILKGVTKSDVP